MMRLSSTTSRRALLAGAASVPALALAGKTASASDPAVAALDAFKRLSNTDLKRFKDAIQSANRADALCDPILGAIEAHRAASKQWDSASLAADRAQGKFCNENGSFTANGLSPALRQKYPQFDRRLLHSHKQIARQEWAPADVKAEMHRELERQLARYAAAVEPLETASEAAERAESEARWALAKTVPTTVAGIAAAFQYLRECEAQEHYELFDSVDSDGGSRTAFNLSIERAACTLAGLPLPPEAAAEEA